MLTRTYPVFVNEKTAKVLKIVESEGRPEGTEGRDAVYVGECDPVTTYQSWDEVPENMRATILDAANRQAIQDAKNTTRADVKGGGSLSLTKQREAHMKNSPTDPTKFPQWLAELQRLNTEIEDARLAKKSAK